MAEDKNDGILADEKQKTENNNQIQDTKYMNVNELHKWLTRNNEYFEMKLVKQEEKEIIEIQKGNPYKLKLPDSWKFDIKRGFINYNKADPEEFKTKLPKEIEVADMMDLAYFIEVNNPDMKCQFYTEQGMPKLQIVGSKGLDDLTLPSGFKFENGVLTNGSNVTCLVSKDVEKRSESATLGELQDGLSADRYTAGSETANVDISDERLSRMATQNMQGNIVEEISSINLTSIDFSFAKTLYEEYSVYLDPVSKKPFVQDRRTGAIVENEEWGKAVLFMNNLISQLHDTTKSTRIDNQTNNTDLSYGEVNWDRVEKYYDQLQDDPEAIKNVLDTNNKEAAEKITDPNKDNSSHAETITDVAVENDEKFEELLDLKKRFTPEVIDGRMVTKEDPQMDYAVQINKIYYIHALFDMAQGNLDRVKELYLETKDRTDAIASIVVNYKEKIDPQAEAVNALVMEMKFNGNNNQNNE